MTNTLSILLAVGLAAPLLSSGLDLAAVTTSLTRADSDSLYSEKYEYKILSDLSIRRSWEDAQHRVILDFGMSDDQLIMAQLHYKSPVDKTLALEDAKTMLPKGSTLGKWKKAKPDQVESLGLGDCFYQKLDDDSFFFIELNKAGKAQCLIYFSTTPRVNRRSLNEAETEAYTAMGSNPNASAALVLLEDETARWEYRQQAAAKRNKAKQQASAASKKPAGTPIAATRPTQANNKQEATRPAPLKIPITSEPVEPPKTTETTTTQSQESKLSVEIIAAIAGAVLILIILICMLSPKKVQVRKMSSPSRVRRLR